MKQENKNIEVGANELNGMELMKLIFEELFVLFLGIILR